jgi:hypothetical protein
MGVVYQKDVVYGKERLKIKIIGPGLYLIV